MKFEAPQIILSILYLLALLAAASKHGEPRTDKYNFGSQFIITAIIFALLYWGGFFA